MKILLLGYYGQSNYGDELMLDAILRNLSEYHVTLGKMGLQSGVESAHGISKNDVVYWAGYNGHFFNFILFVFALIRSDHVIFGGGTLFFDNVDKSYKNLYGLLRVSLLCCLFRKKYSFYGVGIGELLTIEGRKIVRFVLKKSRSVCFRDSESYIKAIKLMGVECDKDKYFKGADPVFLEKKWKNFFNHNDGGSVVFCGMPIEYRVGYSENESVVIEKIARILDQYILGGKTIIMIPMQVGQRDDRQFNRKVYAACKNSSSIELVDERLDFDAINGYLERASCVVTMRYHPALMSLMFGNEVLAICVTEKLLGWCKSVTNYVRYLDVTKGASVDDPEIIDYCDGGGLYSEDRNSYLKDQNIKAKKSMLKVLCH